MTTNKKGLGRGLGELLSIYDEEAEEKKDVKTQVKSESGIMEIEITKIVANPNQPRKNFDENSLNELAESIKIHGIIQPIILNKNDNKYLIIAGERRWRAAGIAGLKTVPAIVKNYTERQIKEISIIENLQREDLNPIEAARAIKQLMEEYNFTQETVADRIGKSRPSIANTLRLLTLNSQVINLIEKNKLSAGHARCLVVIPDQNNQIKLANYSVDKKLSVRELEKIVKNHLMPKDKRANIKLYQSIELKELASEMQRTFSTKVTIIGNDTKGRIYLDYFTRDDLDRIVELVELIKAKKLTLGNLRNFNKTYKDGI